jgi:hypothetical protein
MYHIFESEKMTLHLCWPFENNNLSNLANYDFWLEFTELIEILNPKFVLIDASYIEFRSLTELDFILTVIPNKLDYVNIAFVFPIAFPLNTIIHKSPLLRCKIFNNIDEGICWLKTCKPVIY